MSTSELTVNLLWTEYLKYLPSNSFDRRDTERKLSLCFSCSLFCVLVRLTTDKFFYLRELTISLADCIGTKYDNGQFRFTVI